MNFYNLYIHVYKKNIVINIRVNKELNLNNLILPPERFKIFPEIDE